MFFRSERYHFQGKRCSDGEVEAALGTLVFEFSVSVLIKIQLLCTIIISILILFTLGEETEILHVNQAVKLGKLLIEEIHVPHGQFCGFVIRKPEGLNLILGQIVRKDRRDALEVEEFRRLIPRMTSNDDAVLINDDGNQEAESLNTGSDGVDRRFIVPGIALVRSDG